MRMKSILLTAGIALVVVIAFEKTKGKVPGLHVGA